MAFIKQNKKILRIFKYLIFLAIFVILFVFLINVLMIYQEHNNIVSIKSCDNNPECIMILGCGIWNNRPSPMLEDRLNTGISLYEAGIAPKILVTGDHGQQGYDEVSVMKNYLLEAGIPSEDIFMDHAGFSTYESIVRGKKVFGIQRMLIVSQKYHLYRALFIADEIGIDAISVNSDPRCYRGQFMRELREIIARVKDVFYTIFRIKPTYLGEPVDLSGNGTITNG